ncbi:MAG: transcriptional regulator, partial [Planctomycetes bacterium]|nr:transcriptional regulator [Planctomycetota bacterium]
MNKKRDLRGVRRHNRRVVLEAIKDAGTTTRVDLARRTGLCAATVGFLVDDLLRGEWIRESGKRESSAGRKATILELDPSHWRFIEI